VAFSGEIKDEASAPDGLTENSALLNPYLKSRDIREAFKGEEYQILLVANKFQTGFDQPLLCGMYVDKMLGGIQAVQTLNRLNRAHPGKDTTYVLDFVNDAADVLAAFKVYHTTAELSTTTDPHLVLNLRAKLDAAGHYDDFEVNRIMQRYKTQRIALRKAEDIGSEKDAKAAQDEINALALFKADIGAYLRLYTFLSQIFDYANTDIEKRAIFFKLLLPLLEFDREREGIDLSKVVLTHHT
jgi:type I restriction enzyme, R subunit